MYRVLSGPVASAALAVWGGVRAASTTIGPQPAASPPWAPGPTGPLLTKVEVASLILGLEEASPGLGMNIGTLGHQELHVVFAAALDGDVQGGLAWNGVRDSHQGQRPDQSREALGCKREKSTRGQQIDLQTFPDVESLMPKVPDLLHHASRILGSSDIQLGGSQMWELFRLIRGFHPRGNNGIMVSQNLGYKIHSL